MKGLMLAAPHSGSGKTLLTLVILRTLAQKGVKIAPFKAGPDYIDPALHYLGCGQLSINLDPWAMRPELILSLAASASARGQSLIVEAMMGLFDGAMDGSGTPADLAQRLELPIVLIVDCSKMSHSIAAIVSGFHHFRPNLGVSGLILNKIGSKRHEQMLRQALSEINIPILGAVHRHQALVMPERHLGLVLPQNQRQFVDFIDKASDVVAPLINWDGLEQLMNGGATIEPDMTARAECDSIEIAHLRLNSLFLPHFLSKNRFTLFGKCSMSNFPPFGQHMAIARDDAFCFIYPHILMAWQQAGCQISFFSPLEDEAPSMQADSIYLPGGYPELYAGRLASNHHFKTGMMEAAKRGTYIYGECGGFMVMGESLEDKNGQTHTMLGLLPLATSIKKPRLALGYRQLDNISNFPLPKQMRGHEFHYSQIISQGEAAPLFQMRDASGQDSGYSGLVRANIAGSFLHLIDLV